MLPNNGLNDAYEKAKALLVDKNGKPTSQYQAYMQYEQEWSNKKKAFDAAYATASNNALKLQRWPIEGRMYQHDADEAWNRWVALGYKSEIENAVNILAAQGTDPLIKSIIQNVKSNKK